MPNGRQQGGFNPDRMADLTRTVMEIADRHAGGRVISLLEGGYNLAGLGSAAAAHVGALLGVRDAGVKSALG